MSDVSVQFVTFNAVNEYSLNTREAYFVSDLTKYFFQRELGHGSLMCCTGNGVSATAGVDGAGVGPGRSEELEVNVSVKDGGMMLVTALTPDLRWQSGAAELSMRVHGSPSHPQVINLGTAFTVMFTHPPAKRGNVRLQTSCM